MKRSLFYIKIKTAISLGLLNIFKVILYKISLRFKKENKTEYKSGDQFFTPIKFTKDLKPSGLWIEDALYFGYHKFKLNNTIPNWHQNPFNKSISNSSSYPWWKISDFDTSIGDIKAIWEASRFEWAISFAQQAVNGEKEYINKLNFWIKDWIVNNPPFYGINWKCGQEASIRVMHLAMVSLILDQGKETSTDLLRLISIHLERIAPTINYAVAQNNNHGTSEAAALYIGGNWLIKNNYNINKAKLWSKQGAKWLKNRANKLIESDGSFSQYSVNYHRLMLDAFSMVEAWRKYLKLERLDDSWYKQCKNATKWLNAFVLVETGQAPILGANDGARLLPLSGSDYLDFRPSVQLASVLFLNKTSYNTDGSWNLPLKWLNINIPKESSADIVTINHFDKGGYVVIREPSFLLAFSYPIFKFRPSHADALSVDLWINDMNILRDAGSYGYNADVESMNYFSSTKAHNTVEIDGRSQMPKLSRFLFGGWLKINKLLMPESLNSSILFGAGYEDIHQTSHYREIELKDKELIIKDKINGLQKSAILRYRLHPDLKWEIQDNSIYCAEIKIEVSTGVKINRFEIVDGWESRYYLYKSKVPVLEVEVGSSGTIETVIKWSKL